MKFGHFDDQAWEYVVTRPDTPRPWINYLGTTEYGAIITKHASGYGFYRDAASQRFVRIRGNSPLLDQPGRYFYLCDQENGDFWSESWQPIRKLPDKYESICRHGTGYMVILSRYDGIETEATYFVPLGQVSEYWRFAVSNKSSKERKISAYTYCEFKSVGHLYNDLVDLQYSTFANKAPDPEFDSMVNVWNAYNLRRVSHRPGHEKEAPKEHFCSDNALWLFNAVPAYVAETGEGDFYDEVLPYADKGQATVLGHLRRALGFKLERSGRNGLPCGPMADWNACCNLGYIGERVMVAFQVRHGLGVYAEIAERLGHSEEKTGALAQRETLDKSIQKICWVGEWFIWATGEEGTIFGAGKMEEGQIYINTQAWAVIGRAENWRAS